MNSKVSHPGQRGQVVVACVEDPHGDVAHDELLGQLEAQTDFLKVKTFQPGFTSYERK